MNLHWLDWDMATSNNLHKFYILHRRPYANSSLLLECLSADEGRFPVIVKGGASKKGASGVLQPFQQLLGQWSGRGEIKNLTGFELQGKPTQLKGHSLFFAFYMNELMMYLLARQDTTVDVFELYGHMLMDLALPIDIENRLRHFEVALLIKLGYGLNLSQEVETEEPIQPEQFYDYQVEYGAVITQASPLAIQGETLLALANKRALTTTQKNQARRLMKRIIHYYLNGKPLKSRELFQVLR